VRAASGLVVRDLGSPIDVLWFRLSKKAGDPGQILGHLGRDKMMVTIDRNDYQRRRLFPVKVIQAMQVAVHNRVLKPVVSGAERELTVPWPLKLLNASAWLRRWPAQVLGVGIRPEHVRSPDSP